MIQTVTPRAREEYLPKSESKREGIALCLSGGGFRAALFHLGALRRLNELAVLSKLDAISSVSGGSIISGYLAARLNPWPMPGDIYASWEQNIAAPFRRFTSKNLRTPALLKRLLPWNWFSSSTGVRALAARYEREISRGGTALRLAELPERPRFIFCSTDMAYGVNWIFTRDLIGDYKVGYAITPAEWTVGRAVAASSCFPPVFNPLPIELPSDKFTEGMASGEPDYKDCVAGLRLTDGGNYDNLGLEPVWKNAMYVLVSDGGATFDAEPDHSLMWRLSRYTDILGNQVGALRKRWLITNLTQGILKGTYWSISSDTGSYQDVSVPGYSSLLVDEVIAEIRTDLDAFSTAEAEVLENHGYLLAEAAIRRHVPALAAQPAPFIIPHPEWLDERRVRQALADSGKRKFPFGRWGN